MKITSKLKVALKSILSLAMGEVSTDKGILVWDGEGELAEGIEVFVKDANDEVVAAEDGDYTIEDGKIISVIEGRVASIADPAAEVAPELQENAEPEVAVEAEAETPAEEPVTEPETEEPKDEDKVAALEQKIADIASGIEQVINAVAAMEQRVKEVEDRIAKAEAEPAAEPIETPAIEEAEVKSRMSYLRKK